VGGVLTAAAEDTVLFNAVSSDWTVAQAFASRFVE
jgi:hypothetical protein